MILQFKDNTTLNVLDSSSVNAIQFDYNANTFSGDIAKFTNENISTAFLIINNNHREVILNRKISNKITISNNTVTVGLVNMNDLEQRITSLQIQVDECMNAITELLEMLL